MNTIKLYRPVGIKELDLIIESGYQKFPPRLSWQPIFYPVLNKQYASQIAASWNTGDEFSGYCGIVTEFDLSETLFSKYEIQCVGGKDHQELWVPSDELEIFNENILGLISTIAVFFGEQFVLPENKRLADALSKFKIH